MNVEYWYFRTALSLLIGGIIAVFSFSGLYYVHEVGHAIAGSFVQVFINHRIPLPMISNWIWLWEVIPIPQQTRVLGLGSSTIFAFGGPLATLLAGIYLCRKNFIRSDASSYLWFLLPILILAFELFGNVLFGTDNWTMAPLLSATQYPILNRIAEIVFWPFALWMSCIVFFTEKVDQWARLLSKE